MYHYRSAHLKHRRLPDQFASTIGDSSRHLTGSPYRHLPGNLTPDPIACQHDGSRTNTRHHPSQSLRRSQSAHPADCLHGNTSHYAHAGPQPHTPSGQWRCWTLDATEHSTIYASADKPACRTPSRSTHLHVGLRGNSPDGRCGNLTGRLLRHSQQCALRNTPSGLTARSGAYLNEYLTECQPSREVSNPSIDLRDCLVEGPDAN